jgi:hypothetical protein
MSLRSESALIVAAFRVAKSELTRYTVEVNEEGQSATIPLTVDYRLLEGQEEAEALAEVAKKKAALPRTHTVQTVSVPTTARPAVGSQRKIRCKR